VQVKGDRNYLQELTKLLDQADPKLHRRYKIEFKNCFGAVAGYADQSIFISCGKFGLALRLPANILADLFTEAGATQLKYFPNGHVKKEYAVIPTRILRNQRRFRRLLAKSMEYAVSRSS